MCFALVRVQTGLEVKALSTNVASERLVFLLITVFVKFFHVSGKIEY